MTAYIDPAVRVTIGVSEILSLPRCIVKDKLLTRAARKSRAQDAVQRVNADEARHAQVEAEMHRLNAAADRTYARMAADYTTRIQAAREDAEA